MMRVRPLAIAGAFCIPAFAPEPAAPQPAPSFQSSCEDLRKSMATLDRRGDPLITIDVVGPLTDVKFDGVLAYLSMCKAPHPRVVCVTYSTGGRRPGDKVILTGAIHPRGEDLIVLDPCLHYPPDIGPR
jgi:hypothetical protein